MFSKTYTIRFEHCDPAGIVFYPRYFEILNDIMEVWLAEEIGVSIGNLIFERQIAVPTVYVEAEFPAASYLEDVLTVTLQVTKLGTSSMTLLVEAMCEDEVRFRIRPIIVFTDIRGAKKKSMPIPEDMRREIERYL